MYRAGLLSAGSSNTARRFLLTLLNVLTGLGLLGLFVVHPEAADARPQPRVKQAAAAPLAQPATTETSRLAVAPETTAVPAAPAPPNIHGGVPVGKGMWIWQP